MIKLTHPKHSLFLPLNSTSLNLAIIYNPFPFIPLLLCDKIYLYYSIIDSKITSEPGCVDTKALLST
jgi:hypothetical protein